MSATAPPFRRIYIDPERREHLCSGVMEGCIPSLAERSRLSILLSPMMIVITLLSTTPARSDDPLERPMASEYVGNGGNCDGCDWISARGWITAETPKVLPGFDVLPSPNGEQLYLTTQAPAQADDFERTAAKRAEILAGTDYTRLGTCQGLVRDLYRWGVLDNLATGIAFGLINNTTRIARRAEAIGNHQLRRGSADFVIGFCTATMHIHMGNRDGAKDVPRVSVQGTPMRSRMSCCASH